jgi:ketosteroid isomerase-like protein
MQAAKSVVSAVKLVIQNVSRAFTGQYTSELLRLFGDDKDTMLIGSGADEKRIGKKQIRAQFERDWAQADVISAKFKVGGVSARANVAWTFGELIIEAKVKGRPAKLRGRFTMVLEKKNARWLIMQSHFSLPVADQSSGSSWPR